MLYGHGNDAYQYGKVLAADFSSTIWNNGNSEELKGVIFKIWDKIRHYPHPAAEGIKRLVAKLNAIRTNQVVITNGANEAIYLLAQAYQNAISTIIYPTYSEYEDACKNNKHDINFVHWNDLDENLSIPGGLLFICNPNNPTGAVLQKHTLEKLLAANRNTIFIVDESYIDFTRQITTCVNLIDEFENLILIRSLSATFGIPGLRIGYVLSNEEIANKIESFKMPWSVNTLAIETAKYYLTHLQKYKVPTDRLIEDTKNLMEAISEIDGFTVLPTHTSFFLVEIEKRSAAELKNYLVNFSHILIRDASNFRGLKACHARISTLDNNKNFMLIKALRKWASVF